MKNEYGARIFGPEIARILKRLPEPNRYERARDWVTTHRKEMVDAVPPALGAGSGVVAFVGGLSMLLSKNETLMTCGIFVAYLGIGTALIEGEEARRKLGFTRKVQVAEQGIRR